MRRDKSKEKETSLGAAELEKYRKRLITIKEELRGRVGGLTEKTIGKNPGSEAGDLSTLPSHIADIGSDAFEHDLNLSLCESEGGALEAIEYALEKIKKGTFGICDHCRKPISKARLDAMPYAALCIDCKKRQEHM